jgi:hypothetical protein
MAGESSVPREMAQQVDGSTGLLYLRNLGYDMERELHRGEPLSSPPGLVEHPYMDASVNPVIRVDRLGLFGCGPLSNVCDELVPHGASMSSLSSTAPRPVSVLAGRHSEESHHAACLPEGDAGRPGAAIQPEDL